MKKVADCLESMDGTGKVGAAIGAVTDWNLRMILNFPLKMFENNLHTYIFVVKALND